MLCNQDGRAIKLFQRKKRSMSNYKDVLSFIEMIENIHKDGTMKKYLPIFLLCGK